MKLNELAPGFQKIELYEYSEDFGMLRPPYLMTFNQAVERYGDRKVLFWEDHVETERTEVLIDKL